MPETKQCTRCRITKTQTEFRWELRPIKANPKHRRISSWCNTCQAQATKAWVQQNPEKRRAYTANWRARNPEKMRIKKQRDRLRSRPRTTQRLREQRVLYPEKFRNWVLQRKYGMSYADEQRLCAAQNNCCGICRRCFDQVQRHVDHCHKTRKVRGLLCRTCNVALGGFQDDLLLLRAAAIYLENHVND